MGRGHVAHLAAHACLAGERMLGAAVFSSRERDLITYAKDAWLQGSDATFSAAMPRQGAKYLFSAARSGLFLVADRAELQAHRDTVLVPLQLADFSGFKHR